MPDRLLAWTIVQGGFEGCRTRSGANDDGPQEAFFARLASVVPPPTHGGDGRQRHREHPPVAASPRARPPTGLRADGAVVIRDDGHGWARTSDLSRVKRGRASTRKLPICRAFAPCQQPPSRQNRRRICRDFSACWATETLRGPGAGGRAQRWAPGCSSPYAGGPGLCRRPPRSAGEGG